MQEYVLSRAREPWPHFASDWITPLSTAVTSFGNPETSKVATVGINPSSLEFQTRGATPLIAGNKKLCDYEVLGVTPGSALNEEHGLQVVDACHSYFNGETPATDYFRQNQEVVLSALGKDVVYGVNASHLDLVQWSTKFRWGDRRLPEEVKAELMVRDRAFLVKQLLEYEFKVLYLNGSTVISEFLAIGICSLDLVARQDYLSRGVDPGLSRLRSRRSLLEPNSFYAGHLRGTLVMGATQFIGGMRTYNGGWIKEQISKFGANI